MSTVDGSRRDFIKKTAMAGIVVTSLSGIESLAGANFVRQRKTDHLTFLFRGDSITDGNRGRNNDPNHIVGHGYPFSIASRVGAGFSEKPIYFTTAASAATGLLILHNAGKQIHSV